ncbi:MAG TPA: hypothetical protein VIY54_00605 [Steroidobacteraceae bacterium]
MLASNQVPTFVLRLSLAQFSSSQLGNANVDWNGGIGGSVELSLMKASVKLIEYDPSSFGIG